MNSAWRSSTFLLPAWARWPNWNVLLLRQELLEHQFPLALAPWIDGTPPPMGRVNVGVTDDYLAYIRSLER